MVNCVLFADDTNIFHSCSNLNVLTNGVSQDTLDNWFAVNKLALDASIQSYIDASIHAIRDDLAYCWI